MNEVSEEKLRTMLATETNAFAPAGSPYGFHVMAKPAGPSCNLDCGYCFYLEKERLYPGVAQWRMSDEVLESYIRQYIEAQGTDTVTFSWQGGEPTLLGIDFFRRAVDLQRKYANGKRVENAFQTNGILLNDAWGEFFAANDFLIGLSIDGPRKLHDQHRVDKGGHPTFDRVMRGLNVLKSHNVEFNTLTVVHRHNAQYPLDVYRFLKQAGSGFIQFIPLVERAALRADPASPSCPADADAEARVSPWSVEPLQYGHFLCRIFDEWVRNDVGRVFVQLFDVALEMWCGRPASLCVFGEHCGGALAVEHNGDLFSCDHFVYPENRLGNLMQEPLSSLVYSTRQRAFGQNKYESLPKFCRTCDMRFACNGECPKHRIACTPDGEEGLNYLCGGYKLFFHRADPYMRFMARELRALRPPANVMLWARQRDVARSGARPPGRNNLCPCGSNLKYKKCCGQFTSP